MSHLESKIDMLERKVYHQIVQQTSTSGINFSFHVLYLVYGNIVTNISQAWKNYGKCFILEVDWLRDQKSKESSLFWTHLHGSFGKFLSSRENFWENKLKMKQVEKSKEKRAEIDEIKIFSIALKAIKE